MSELISLDGGSIDDLVLVVDIYQYDSESAKRGEKGAYIGKQATYWCESCGNSHQIGLTVNGERYKHGASWDWNGRVDEGVVFGPSQLMRTYRYPVEGTDSDIEEFDKLEKNFDVLVTSRFRHVCHTFIGMSNAPAGHITWLNDCFHDGKPSPLCGQVRKLMPRKDWPGAYGRSWAHIAVKE